MQKGTIKVLITLFFSLWITGLSAQNSIHAGGGNASGSDGNISYSVGQVFYNTSQGTNGSIIEGVQQPYEISVIIGIDEIDGINLYYSAHPNPVTEFLTLSINGVEAIKLLCSLYDLDGKLIRQIQVTDPETKIWMADLVPASYIIRLTQGNKVVRSFKVVKL